MLVKLRADTWRDLCRERARGLAWCECINVKYARELHFELNGTVLVKVIVETVLCKGYSILSCLYHEATRTVVGHGANHADDEPTTTHGVCAPSFTVVGVLPKQSGVLFVNANRAVHINSMTILSDE
jgi:hypothetical protein